MSLAVDTQLGNGCHHDTGHALGIHVEPWSRIASSHVGIYLMLCIHHVDGEIHHYPVPHLRHCPDSDHRKWALSVDVVCMLMR